MRIGMQSKSRMPIEEACRPPTLVRESPRVPHSRRPFLARCFPVRVTVRMRPHVSDLRSWRSFRTIRAAFYAGNNRFGFRLNHYSVQGNHIHLIVEAKDRRALWRGMQGLSIRIAKKLNRMMQRRGKVFDDRYHARILRTPAEARRAMHEIIHDAQKHTGMRISNDPFCSIQYLSLRPPLPVIAPRTWMLRIAVLDVRAAPS